MTKRRVRPSDIVHDAIEEVTRGDPEISADVSVDDLPVGNADPALLRQVFASLVGNALKFSRHRQPARVTIGATRTHGQVAYYVRDNGVGFDMDYAHKLFGVFQRLHSTEEFDGTGVGLALVQRIVERRGGRVCADAAVGEGATFSSTLSPVGSDQLPEGP